MLKFEGLHQAKAEQYRAGGPDAYGFKAERFISDGDGVPCRCCLRSVPKGQEALVLAHRPFTSLQPYAETGPIFICAEECARQHEDGVPQVLTLSPDYLVKAYSAKERIIYGTGRITPADEVLDYVGALLSRADVAFVDIRSARNNCWLARAKRN